MSVATQFAKSAVPVFITSTVTAFVLAVGSCTAHVFVTVSPGVSHWNFAESIAVVLRFASSAAEQKQLSVAVSGSNVVLPVSASLHVVSTTTGVDVIPAGTLPMFVVVLRIPVLLSVTVHEKRSVPPLFLATNTTRNGSAAIVSCVFQPMHECVPSSLFVTNATSTKHRFPVTPVTARHAAFGSVVSPVGGRQSASVVHAASPHETCLSTCALQTSQVSGPVAVIVFGPTEPTMLHVTDATLHEFVVSPVSAQVTADAVAPAARLAMVVEQLGTPWLVPEGDPFAGHPASVKFVSLTTHWARSAVPVFFTVIVMALLPLASCTAQFFVTCSPGVSHLKFASSKADFCTSPGVGVQSHVTVAVSGSAAERVSVHAALLRLDLKTQCPPTAGSSVHAGWPPGSPLVQHVPPVPQSLSAAHIASTLPTAAPGNPVFVSVSVQLSRSAVPPFATT